MNSTLFTAATAIPDSGAVAGTPDGRPDLQPGRTPPEVAPDQGDTDHPVAPPEVSPDGGDSVHPGRAPDEMVPVQPDVLPAPD